MNRVILVALAFSLIQGFPIYVTRANDLLDGKVKAIASLHNDAVADQDDLCFWTDPKDPTRCRVIVSDKKANLVFVYSLDGKLTQSVEVPKPGNIDIRHGVALGGQVTDIVAVNVRADGWKVRLFAVDPASQQLVPIDAGGISTQPNYGSCLASDMQKKKFWYISTSESSGVIQYEITRSLDGSLLCNQAKRWDLGKCEGVVADDDAGKFYVAVEQEGIWQFELDPTLNDPPQMIIPLGKNGLAGDLEGLTLAKLEGDRRVLIVSSQAQNQFFIFDRESPWSYRGKFEIEGVTQTDGIDLFQSQAIAAYPDGIFGCHTSQSGHPITLAAWKSILSKVENSRFDAPR
jgi:3-phytase